VDFLPAKQMIDDYFDTTIEGQTLWSPASCYQHYARNIIMAKRRGFGFQIKSAL